MNKICAETKNVRDNIYHIISCGEAVLISRHISIPLRLQNSPGLLDECIAASGGGYAISSCGSGNNIVLLDVQISYTKKQNVDLLDNKITEIEPVCDRINNYLKEKLSEATQ